jgi:hypothetical protein
MPFVQVENESGRVEYRFTLELTKLYSSPLLSLPPLASGQPVQVDWSVRGTGDHPVTPEDFQGGVFPSGTVSFTPEEVAAGITRKPISFVVQGDGQIEADELFLVEFTHPTGGSDLYFNRYPLPALASAWVGTVVDPALDVLTGIPGVPLVGDGGPDRLIAAGKGKFTLQGNGGADEFVLVPSREDFAELGKGNTLSTGRTDTILDFSADEGDRFVLDSGSFPGLKPSRFRVRTAYGWSE